MHDSLPDATEHLGALGRYARALTRDAAQADDLVQDTLVRALERAATYRPGQPLRAWLFAILHNLFLDGRRRMASEHRRHRQLVDMLPAEGVEGDQELTVHLREVAARFDALPDEQRAVLHLVGVEGLTYQEASIALDVPIGTVMSRLSRARAALRAGAHDPHGAGRLHVVGGTDAS